MAQDAAALPDAGTAATPEQSAEIALVVPADAPQRLLVTTNGWLDSRQSYTRVGWDRLLPSRDVPTWSNLSEANIQLKLRWKDKDGQDVGDGGADVSFLYQKAGGYWTADDTGQQARVADHDVATYHPAAIVSELYGNWRPSEHLQILLGKKRITWGPGITLNPTDLLNPPKDPSDPTLQRAGAWLARVEAPFEKWTLSLVGAAKVTRQYGGIPGSLLYYPDYPALTTLDNNGNKVATADDTRPHFATALRAYGLWHETDINAMVYMTQLYNDAFTWKPRLGLSASHIFANAWELHVEALGQTGSARLQVQGDCVQSLATAVGCVTSGKPVAGYSKLDDGVFRAKAIAGVRYMFGDAAQVSAEYLYNGDGYNSNEFSSYISAVQLMSSAARSGLTLPSGAGLATPAPSDPGSPQRFAFDPVRRHYALLSYQQSQIADDWSVIGLVLMDLEDFSGTLAPTVTWSAREWLSITAAGFMSIPGVQSRGGLAGDGTRYSEFGVNPLVWRAFLSARLFY